MPRNVTLGMFVIDEFRYLDKNGNDDRTKENRQQIGGAGTYYIIGARVFLQPDRLGQVVHLDNLTEKQEDQEVYERLLTYGEGMWEFKKREDGQGTTRALNTFKDEARDFVFTTTPIRIFPDDIISSPRFFKPTRPTSLHFPTAPPRTKAILDQVERIDAGLRQERGDEGWSPELVWEPFPNNCTAEEYEDHRVLMPRVTIISPNHVEALSLYGRIPSPNTSDSELVLLLGGERKVEEALEEVGTQLLSDMQADRRYRSQGGWERGVVIRCGAKGCMVFTANGIERLPAYSTDSKMVVDVTGGGNAFLGGLVAGLDRTKGKSLVEAARYGAVAASFAIQQSGLPVLAVQDGKERWNGDDPEARLEAYRRRTLTTAQTER